MAQTSSQLPLDSDGICMLCKEKPSEEATLCCATCATPWHMSCLSQIKNSSLGFECPDCSGDALTGAPAPADADSKDLFAKIREIEADDSLSEAEKASKRQQLLCGNIQTDAGEISEEKVDKSCDILAVLGETLKCAYCMELPERPVTVLILLYSLLI